MRFTHPSLPKPWSTAYTISKAMLLAAYVSAVFFFLFLILFPSQVFQFDFRNAKASKNTITEPRNANNELIFNGKTPANTSMLFDTAIDHGTYDVANIEISKNAKSGALTNNPVFVQKSYRAFFYPNASDMLSVPTGTLLKNNGQYFIINQNHERIAFASESQAIQLGFDPESFITVSNDELQTIPQGQIWSDTHTYPEGVLFLVDTTYYQLLQNTLHPFVSANAFLSKYPAHQAIQKNPDFLSQYPISDIWLGFQNASLLSFADGVFIVDGEEIRPIGSVAIFESLGFNWDDVTPVSEEEIGIYKRGKIVLQDTPHPDGTIFVDTDSQQYYIIQNHQKYTVPNNWLLHTYLKNKHAIAISEKNAIISAGCALEKQWFFSTGSYTCDIPLDVINPSQGNAFMFTYATKHETDMQDISVTLKSTVSLETSHQSLAQIKQRILTRFGYGE